MKDMYDNEIEVGDEVIYARGSGWSLELMPALVFKVGENYVEVKAEANTKRTRISTVKRIMVSRKGV